MQQLLFVYALLLILQKLNILHFSKRLPVGGEHAMCWARDASVTTTDRREQSHDALVASLSPI